MTGRVRSRAVIFAAIRELLPPVVLLLVVLGSWLVSPSQVELATRAALHGLCAQRPSHSFWFGPHQLPFDARMTGIYGGSLLTVTWLALRHSRGAVGSPRAATLAVLAAGIALLGIDGLNALAADLHLPTLYEPRNTLRYLTGGWTGVTLGVLLWWVFQSTTWRPAFRHPSPSFHLGRDGLPLGLALTGFGWLVMTGPIKWYVPVAVMLLIAAVVTLALLAWPVALLVTHWFERAERWQDLGGPGLFAFAAATSVMTVTSLLRYALEAALAIPPLP
ncbi:DUF2085 domain-containing protein [Thermomicrobium sp. CFH 73360]|uniref:DUF2085 domain-containing protein n=1 Tax=Thermomicrobium sp. CFH 73360 TaxID=2951987 RepID=UPI00207779A5|nr:DUF2085 domain-containing protein [Thermomicrobium sp. CFH 73360]